MTHCPKCEEELGLLLSVDDCFCIGVISQLPLDDDAMTVTWKGDMI